MSSLKIVQLVLELILTLGINTVTALCNPGYLFGNDIPGWNPARLSLFLGFYSLVDIYISEAFSLERLRFGFGIDFSIADYCVGLDIADLDVALHLSETVSDFWRNPITTDQSRSSNAKSTPKGPSNSFLSSLLAIFPSIKIKVGKVVVEINDETSLAVEGLEILVNFRSGLQLKTHITSVDLTNTNNSHKLLLLGTLDVFVQQHSGGSGFMDVTLSSVEISPNAVFESQVLNYAQLLHSQQYILAECWRRKARDEWYAFVDKLQKIEQIRTTRERGHIDVNDHQYFFDCSKEVAVISLPVTIKLNIDKVYMQRSAGIKDDEDVVIETVLVEMRIAVEAAQSIVTESSTTSISIKSFRNAGETSAVVDNLLLAQLESKRTTNTESKTLLDVTSNRSVFCGDVTVIVNASLLRGIVSILDAVKFLGRSASNLPARQSLMEPLPLTGSSQCEFSTGTISIFLKTDEVNSSGDSQQHFLVKCGQITNFQLDERSKGFYLEGLHVYVSSYDIDLHSLEGMMLYGNAIISLRHLQISLPRDVLTIEHDYASEQLITPSGQLTTFMDWHRHVTDSEITANSMEINLRTAVVHISQSDIISLAFFVQSISQNNSQYPENILTTLKTRSFSVMPSRMSSTKIKVGTVSVTITMDNKLQRYRLLHNKNVNVSLSSVGTWWSSTDVVIQDDIEVNYFDGHVGFDRLLFKAWAAPAIVGHPASTRSLRFSSLSTFAEFHSTSHTSVGVGFMMSSSKISIPKISVALDVEDIKPLLVVKAACQTCYPRSERPRWIPFYESEVVFTPKFPSSMFYMDTHMLKATLDHTVDGLRLPVVGLYLESLEIGQVDFAGSTGQLSIGLSNLKATDLSNPLAAHKVIVESVDSAHPNKVSIHITGVKGENGIFEVSAEYLRVVYLQRTTMTLVTFFRDHFFGAMSEVSAHIPQPAVLPSPILPGIYRLCVVLRRAEYHMPTSSSGSDALVAFLRRAILYRTTDEFEKTLAPFCRGPFQSKQLWLSELQHIRKLTQRVFEPSRGGSGNDHSQSEQSWKLLQYRHELMFHDHQPVDSPGYLKVEAFEAAVTSWCNSNLITSSLDAICTIKIVSADPNADEAYEVYEGDRYLMSAYTARNSIYVAVYADEIEWVMAQGQYWMIVNCIQQNFMENNVHCLDPWIMPVYKKVDLGERIYGANPLYTECPIASSVPVYINKGSIIAAENDQDYLDNFLAFMPVMEDFSDVFHHDFDMHLASTVPVQSPYHRFREPLLSRWLKSDAKKDRSGGGGERDRAMKEYHHGLETPFAIKFENLFLDFYRYHFGAGNGIEATATTFVIQQQARSEHISEGVRAQGNMSFDDTDIRDLVLAPRHLPVFHWKEGNRTRANTVASESMSPNSPLDSEPSPVSPSKPHIRYSQQGVANLRRCCIYVDDTMVISNITTMLAVIDFFVIPIEVTGHRNLQLVESRNKGPFDYRLGLDVELHMDHCYVCAPDPLNGLHALCFDVKVDFMQCLRGFLNVGPGCARMDLDVNVNNIFMAPLNEVNNIFMKPLVDPVKFRFTNEYFVLPTREMLDAHMLILSPWITFTNWATESVNKYDRASATRVMRFFIGPLIVPEEIDEEGDKDDVERVAANLQYASADSVRSTIRGQCSLKDLVFILSVVNGIRRSLKKRILNLPRADIYRPIIQNVDDMKHLESLDEVLVHTSWNYDLTVDVKEIHADLSNFDFHVRNNTYNVNLGRLKLEDILIIYARTPDHMHMATEVRLDAWTYNDDNDDWEPLIEPIQMRAIGATDDSHMNSLGSTGEVTAIRDASSIRIDVITEGLEINAQQQSLTSLIRKIRLGDVLTTSSSRLPPYMIINEFGVSCKFSIGIQGTIVIASEINASTSYPVEVSRLADSLNSVKRQRLYQTGGFEPSSGGDNREYFIWISFTNFSHTYECKVPLCIDKVGVHSFEMQLLKGGGKRDSRAFRKTSAGDAEDASGTGQVAGEPVKYVQELPLAILDMKIKDDGVRELHLRGWLSFKNTTGRLMQIQLRLYGSSFEVSIAPGKEWHAPVRFANPKTSLSIRFDNKSSWIELLPGLSVIIAGGTWGNPTKLRARLCRCFREHDDEAISDPRWILLVRPEAKPIKNTAVGAKSTANITVKYPTRDNYTKTKFGVGQLVEDNNGGDFQIDDLQLASVISGTVSGFSANFLNVDQSMIRPVCINLQAPLQFCSFLPQPLLYRLVDSEGNFCASGIVLPGQTIDIHHIPQIFQSRLLISVRMINYGWSPWEVIFGRSTPYSNAEKSTELVMQSLLFASPLANSNKDMTLPQLGLLMVVKEFFVRFTCQMVISNYSGQELQFAEGSNTDVYLPLGSVASVKDYVDSNVPAKRKSLHGRRSQVRRSYVNYTAEDYVESDDDDNSSSAEGKGAESTADSSSDRNTIGEMSSGGTLPQSPPHRVQSLDNHASNNRFKQIMNLRVHLPQDHQKVIEVIASTSWTMEDLFMDIKHRIDNYGVDLSVTDFRFFPWVIDQKSAHLKNVQPTEDEEDQKAAAPQPQRQASQTNVGNEMPVQMRFDLPMVLTGEPWGARMPVSMVTTPEILVCHESELAIYRQCTSIRGESISKEGIKAFFGKTKYVFRATLARMVGEFPFKPYRMLGNPLTSISVPNETEWSSGIDIIKGEFDTGEMVLSLPSKRGSDQMFNPLYEFGVYLERGTGFMQHCTTATIVPKHIFMSKLSFPIDIRQIDFEYTPSIIFLMPNGSCNFHYPNKHKLRLLQIKRSPIDLGEMGDDSNSSKLHEMHSSFHHDVWSGEVDVSTLGIVYVRLRDPLTIIKVETEVVGGSLVATFSEQSLIWPPYRIDNKTATSIRLRQDTAGISVPGSAEHLSSLQTTPNQLNQTNAAELGEEGGGAPDEFIREPAMSTSVAGSVRAGVDIIVRTASNAMGIGTSPMKGSLVSMWDEIDPFGSFPYTWDNPFTGHRALRLELSTGGYTTSKLINLDDDIKDDTMTLRKKVPNLGNPLAEGYLIKCDAAVESKVYCILRPDVLYVYEKDETDASKQELLDVILLSKIKRTNKLSLGSIQKLTQEKGKDFLSNTLQEFFSNITSTVNFIRQKTKMKFDLNYIRTLILTLADHLNLFSMMSPEKLTTTSTGRRRTYSDDLDVGLSLPDRSQTLSTDSLDSFNERSTKSLSNASMSGRGSGGSITDNNNNNNGTGSSSKVLRLKELLSAGISTQDLLDEAAKSIVYTSQIIEAILASNDKYTLESAKELCAWLILQEYLIPYNPEDTIRSFSADVHNSAPRASVFESNNSGFLDAPTVAGAMNSGFDSRQTSANFNHRPSTILSIPKTAKANQYYQTLLQECENMELIFVPPVLNPEMLEMQMQMMMGEGVAERATTSASGRLKQATAGVDETYGFTISIGERTYSFKCASVDEFRGWMQSTRLSIELGWVDFVTGKKVTNGPKLSDYQTTYHLKTRADGSTKVLEITELGGVVQKNIAKRVTSTLADAFSFLPVFKKTKRSLNVANLEELKEGIDADRQLISVLFNVRSVSLSIIDSAPAEVLYIRLQDVAMNVIRYLRAVQFTVTVRQMQFVDQLLNPCFPVTLFTRKLSPEESKKIVLPGFDDGLNSHPSLHLHLQQRYFRSAKSKAASAQQQGSSSSSVVATANDTKNDASSLPTTATPNTTESKLWYFDVFTIWLAPMHLGVDEEIFVRLFRFIQSVRSTLAEDDSGRLVKGRKLQVEVAGSAQDYRLLSTDLDRSLLHTGFMQLIESGRIPYAQFAQNTKRPLNIYFGLLQLYPLEVSINFRPSPDVKMTNAEYAMAAIIDQLDNAKIKLHALFTENAFGSTVIIKEIIVKHYRAAFWKQFRNFIGATDIVEGSVGLVANLGTGVYDLFSETHEGIAGGNNPAEKKSFFSGLSRGGMSFASHTIGGTSGFTSRIAGGIGKGVSILTLDTEFQRNRNYRKYNQAATISEGLYVGTQELGRNIVEGVTGIVVSPYRGWESGGGVGLATGMARGLLGVALKPAIGVLDLASRATEGLRNTAMHFEVGISAEIEGVRRCRIPRAFGRAGLLQIYDSQAAAAQCLADYLADFKYDPRLLVVAHLYSRRKIELVKGIITRNAEREHQSSTRKALLMGELVPDDEDINIAPAHIAEGSVPDENAMKPPLGRVKSSTTASGAIPPLTQTHSARYHEEALNAARDYILQPSREAWGMTEESEYVILVTPDRVALVEVSNPANHKVTLQSQQVSSNMSIATDAVGDDTTSSVSSAPAGSTTSGSGQQKQPGHQAKQHHKKKASNVNAITIGGPAGTISTVSSNHGDKTPSCRFVWVCPADCIDELSSDNRGDMQLKLNTSLCISGAWHQPQPVLLDSTARNYLIFQSLLEQMLGVMMARQQPLQPPYRATHTINNSIAAGSDLAPASSHYSINNNSSSALTGSLIGNVALLAASNQNGTHGGLLQSGIRKKYSTGFRSVLMSPTVHTYWVFGHVLYEYTAIKGTAAAALANQKPSAAVPNDLASVAKAAMAAAAVESTATMDSNSQHDGSKIGTPMSDMSSVATPATTTTAAAAAAETAPADPNSGLTPIEDLMQKTIAALANSPPQKRKSHHVHQPATQPEDDSPSNQASTRIRPFSRSIKGGSANSKRRTPSYTSNVSSPDKAPGGDDNSTVDDNNSVTAFEDDDNSVSGAEAPKRRASSIASSASSTDFASQQQHGNDNSSRRGSNVLRGVISPPELQDHYLSFVYPLVDLTMHGPTPEDNGKYYSISVQRMDGAKLRCLRRDDPHELLTEYMKTGLSLLFPTREMAMTWRIAIESRITLRPPDCLPFGALTTEDRRRESQRFFANRGGGAAAATAMGADGQPVVSSGGHQHHHHDHDSPPEHSVLGILVLPTSGLAEKETETIKIEIFKTISAVRR